METPESKKQIKISNKKTSTYVIRVTAETRKRIASELAKINKKSIGKTVKVDALVAKLLPKLSAQDITELQEASLTGKDRLEQSYRTYCGKFGMVKMDQFLEIISRESAKQMFERDSAEVPNENAS